MFLDRRHRLVSYHDTWVSIDPVQGCPYQCAYCVLRHANATGISPKLIAPVTECVHELLTHPLFSKDLTPIAIGNETDMMHPKNVDCLVTLLEELHRVKIANSIILITKAPLADPILRRIRAISLRQIVFFLSYSGLGKTYEPNFSDEQLRENFKIATSHSFPVVHYWRPLLPENTTTEAIEKMLAFVSTTASATVFVGMKLHPELTKIVMEGGIKVPEERQHDYGEWLAAETIAKIYSIAKRLCPEYPLYRHASCALAFVRKLPNHTATVFRPDICLPSHCSSEQRRICERCRQSPSEQTIARAIERLRRPIHCEIRSDRVEIHDEVSQEEFSYLLQAINYPLQVSAVRMQNLYRGNILEGQSCIAKNEPNQ
jgi:DNA repair photolyase